MCELKNNNFSFNLNFEYIFIFYVFVGLSVYFRLQCNISPLFSSILTQEVYNVVISGLLTTQNGFKALFTNIINVLQESQSRVVFFSTKQFCGKNKLIAFGYNVYYIIFL